MAYDEVFVPLVTEAHFKKISMQHFHQYSPPKHEMNTIYTNSINSI